ncbi:metallophosphoesterase [Roseibium sp. RKSG952]|uniref:metallophosphoesterase family protein n=1 Tax=Roseibium sp. RKSG952 TaxID=2529384 RepID=UPI0012BB7CED|nr:metallophosphoesterase family protein [Roseibium sp. RKSG952]MTH99461.1 metallophosphoesterase [Roseibium sp. RKSG952]
MKIAVVSDIHGNLPALEAVLEDLEHEAPDETVNLGDCVSGPLWPEETAAVLRQTGWPTVRGNHDRVVVSARNMPRRTADGFSFALLSEESKAWLRDLPATLRLTDEIFLCHGTPEVDDVYLTEEITGPKGHLPDEQTILEALGGESSPVICCGHTHIPRVIRLSKTDQTILNPGSVGLPSYDDSHPLRHKMEIGSPHARYALMRKTSAGWSFTEKVLPYDWEKAAIEAERNSRPDWGRSLRHGFFGPLS